MFGSLTPELKGNQVPVLSVTGRLPEVDETASAIVYGSDWSASGVLGIVDVQIGKNARDWILSDVDTDEGRIRSDPEHQP